MKEYLEKSSKILDELQTTEQGLSEAEAARRLSEHGPNRLAAGKKKSNLQRFFEELKDPMILILLAAALISGITSAYEGESYADVVIILTVVIINAVLGVLQESKAEKAIEALQEIAAATSKVMRGGKMEAIRRNQKRKADEIREKGLSETARIVLFLLPEFFHTCFVAVSKTPCSVALIILY